MSFDRYAHEACKVLNGRPQNPYGTGHPMKALPRTLANLDRFDRRLPVAAIALSALLAACAEIPKSTMAESQFGTLSCAELAQQADEENTTKAAADQAKSDSWHAVVPLIVAARYGRAASASNEADRRLALLKERSIRLGTVHPTRLCSR